MSHYGELNFSLVDQNSPYFIPKLLDVISDAYNQVDQ